MKQAPLSPEKMRAFEEFIWRAMGRLDGAQSHDLLDPNSELGRLARAYYEELAEGRPWDEMADYLSPIGSDALPEHLPEDPLPKSDLGLGD
ncbi:MAG: hypothetical protein RBR52_04465 [Thiomonas sp.]|uniref:hypothetical protein n=1 Tax=Thiomonas sp. TaxID=2047785 RepID=UPI002A368282|nr:hypothetical protein [Thiomonas sp.]MDY0329732.1 hypothetical protein [Thiomonas sp.]